MSIRSLVAAFTIFSGLAFAQAQGPTKIAILHINQAIVATKEGQKTAGELQVRFEPKRKALEARQAEIASLQQEYNKGANTMAEAKRTSLQREIDTKTKQHTRDMEDAEAEWQQEQGKIINELGSKVMVVVGKYAKDNGYTLVLDVSSEQSPVLWAADGVNITADIIALYDKSAPVSAAPSAAPSTPAAKPPAAAPTKPPTSPAKPPTAPPK